MPDRSESSLVPFLLRHLVSGTIGAAVFGGLLLAFDIAGLKSMIFASPERDLVLFMLFFGLWITFGSIAMAAGVMGLGRDGERTP
jgi:hypothetical protein